MAKFILRKPKIVINGVDLSNRANQVAITTTSEEVDLTTFGAVNKQTGKGLGDGSMQITFIMDYEVAQVDATLWPLSQGENPFFVEILPVKAAKSPTNPMYKMESQLFSYDPLSGQVGQASTTQVNLKNVGEQGIERLTE
jgi:hypothetical protein